MIIPSVTKYLQQERVSYNDNVKEQMALAGKNFYIDNKDRLPTSVSSNISDFVTFKELASMKYLSKDVFDYDKSSCMDDSYVVARNDGTETRYVTCLICGGNKINWTEIETMYCKKLEKNSVKESVGCSVSNHKYNTFLGNASVTVNYNNVTSDYKIVIFDKEGKETSCGINSNSNSQDFILDQTGNNKIYIMSNEKNYKKYCGSVNVNSASTSISANMYVLKDDSTSAKSPEELKTLEKYDGSWTNKSIYVDVKATLSSFDGNLYYSDGNKKYVVETDEEKNAKYFIIENEGDKTWKISGKLKEDNSKESSTSISTKIDKTKPTITLKGGNENWTNSNVKVNYSAKDELSGVKLVKVKDKDPVYNPYKTYENPTSGTVNGFKEYTDTMRTYVYMIAIDAAGNTSGEQSKEVKIDKIPPHSSEVTGMITSGSMTDYKTNCNGVGGDLKYHTCTYCMKFKNVRPIWGFDLQHKEKDTGGSGISYKEYLWDHTGAAASIKSWSQVSSDFAWSISKGKYQNYFRVTYGVRSIDIAGNVGKELKVTYHIYDQAVKLSDYNACVKGL